MKPGTLLRVRNHYAKAWRLTTAVEVVGDLEMNSILIYLGEKYLHFITLSKYGICNVHNLNVEGVK
jgi:hypothetical protein